MSGSTLEGLTFPMIQLSPHALWLGNIRDARNLQLHHELGIDALVQLAIEEAPVAAAREIINVRIPLLDGDGNPPEHLQLAIQTVAGLVRRRCPTLICCGAGMSRSPAIAAAALALLEGKSARDWLLAIQALTPTDISPGLWRELVQVQMP